MYFFYCMVLFMDSLVDYGVCSCVCRVPQKEKTMQALTKWRDLYNSEKETSFVGDQLVRTLVLAGLYTLSSQVQAIKIYAKAIRL